MNRKERIARRLEGIGGDTQPVLLQNCRELVTHRLLEEDTPRYTRASDACSPPLVRRSNKEGLEHHLTEDSPSERQSRPRCRGEVKHMDTESPYVVRMDTEALDAKAERIAKYKAERRRQLAEKYGIALDSEPDGRIAVKYPRARKESDPTEKVPSQSEKDYSSDLIKLHSSRDAMVRESQTLSPRERKESFSPDGNDLTERETLLNKENHKKALETSAKGRILGQSYVQETSANFKDSTVSDVPGSPASPQRISFTSPKPFSESFNSVNEQSQNLQNKQGNSMKVKNEWFLQRDSNGETPSLINWPSRVKVRERMLKDEGIQSSPEIVKDITPRRLQQVPVHCTSLTSESPTVNTVSKPTAIHQPVFVQSTEDSANTMTKEYKNSTVGNRVPGSTNLSTARVEEINETEYGRCVSGPESKLNEPGSTRNLLKSRKAVLPSQVRKQEKNHEESVCDVKVVPEEGEKPHFQGPSIIDWYKPRDTNHRGERAMNTQKKPGVHSYVDAGRGKDQIKVASPEKYKLKYSALDNFEAPKVDLPNSEDLLSGDAGTVATRVSVAQLRRAYMETANASRNQDL